MHSKWVLLMLQLTSGTATGAASETDSGQLSADSYRRLADLAWQRGARFPKVEIGLDASGQRGLFVIQGEEIEAGEPIIIMPGSFAIRSSEVLQRFKTRTGKAGGNNRGAHTDAIPPEIEGMTAAQLLMGRLLEEFVEPYSVWRAYLRTLPPLHSLARSLPFLWPEPLREAIVGSAGYEYTERLRSDLRESLSRLCLAAPVWREAADPRYARASKGSSGNRSKAGEQVRKDIFCDQALGTWAFAIVRTRCFSAPDDPQVGLLLPLADFANHAPDAPEFHLPFSNGAGYAGLVASMRLRPTYTKTCYSRTHATYQPTQCIQLAIYIYIYYTICMYVCMLTIRSPQV